MRTSRKWLWLVLLAAALIALLPLVRRGGRDTPPVPGPDAGSHAAGRPAEGSAGASNLSRRSPREADRELKAQGVRTDVGLADFPSREYQRLPSPAGKAAGAPAGEVYIHVPSAGRRVAMEPNQLGEFPTMETRLKDTVGVRLSLEAVMPGTPVRVVILDGGSFPSVEGVSQVIKAADWHGVAFEFTTSSNTGSHRVLVQAVGQPARILDFNALATADP